MPFQLIFTEMCQAVRGQASKLYIWVIQSTGEVKFQIVDMRLLQQQYGISLDDLIFQTRISIETDKLKSLDALDTKSHQTLKENPNYLVMQQLYQFLIHPISSYLPNKDQSLVVFIPHKTLFLIPLSALQDDIGRFLVEKYTVLYASSIQVLDITFERSKTIKDDTSNSLLVGNPEMPIIPLSDPPNPLPPLPWAEIEVEAISMFLNTKPITGSEAVKTIIKKQMPKAQFIHLATHGLLGDTQQFGSPGAIALAPSENDNGFLTAEEILKMQLNAKLVVLSACSTGQGKITGDGVIGLSRSLIAAGVPSIIVSLWSVSDQSTAFMMIKFYQNLQQGMKPVVALNRAQNWLIKITRTEIENWINVNQEMLTPTLRITLYRKLKQLSEDDYPFHNPRNWAAFCEIGQ